MINKKRLIAFIVVVVTMLSVIITTTPDLTTKLRLGLDLRGGFEILYEAEAFEPGAEVTRDALLQTARSLRDRIDKQGTTEPEILPEGNDRIRVRIAGVEDERSLREMIARPAELTFRGPDGTIELRGVDFKEGAATVVYDEFNQPVVSIEVKNRADLERVSRKLLGQPMAIVLDDELISAPVVQGVFTDGKATISGNFDLNGAKELADIINLGSLPLKLTEIYMQSVGASLGQQSLEQTVIAGLVGSILILLFMLFIYRIPGIIASITLITYTWGLLLIFYWLNAVLTLPGIAAFVLGIGMAVDANIITFERLKEELRTGKSFLSAMRAGSKNSIRTILDANLTSLIAAAVLYYVGTGAIQGFALVLMLSIGLSMLTNVLLSQSLLTLLIRTNVISKPSYYGLKQDEIKTLAESKTIEAVERFDFVTHRKRFFTFSITVTALGIISIALFWFNLGVDFKAGTSIDIEVGKQIERTEAEQLLNDIDLPPANITIGGTNQSRVSVRFDRVLESNPVGVEQTEIERIMAAFAEYAGQEVTYEENTVNPAIARELAMKALIAVLMASVGILIYVSVRFEWRMALAAVIALIHNAFFVISIFSIFRLEIDLTFIAAILTIIGYTLNDTVVIFDRVRENMRTAKIKSFNDLVKLVNQSINQTLTRTINTGLTLIFATVAILIFGSKSIFLFSLAMTVGLLIGVYSSMFIASQLWLVLRRNSLTSKSAKQA